MKLELRDDEKPLDTRKAGDDVLDDTVGKILLLRVPTHICERHHRQRWLVGRGKGGLLIARSTLVPLLLDGDRPDIAVAAARQSLNSAVAAGLLRKDPPQRRNLDS